MAISRNRWQREGPPHGPSATHSPGVTHRPPGDAFTRHMARADAVTSAPASTTPNSGTSKRYRAMPEFTRTTSKAKARGPTSAGLPKLLEMIGRHLLAADDAAAARHGWEITVRHGGLGREYRDPRFSTLRSCPLCDGRGGAGHELCAQCDGTGRVTSAAVNGRGQGQ